MKQQYYTSNLAIYFIYNHFTMHTERCLCKMSSALDKVYVARQQTMTNRYKKHRSSQ
jgi:hypothetical protein